MAVITWDTEANNLLNGETIDYTASPYVLKPSFAMHSIVVEEHDTGNIIAFYDGDTYVFDGRDHEEIDGKYTYSLKNYPPIQYEHKQLSEFPVYIKSKPLTKVIAHNQINYDLLVAKLWFGMDYEVEKDSWCGKPLEIVDTMVLSKVLNPDRYGGHSLDNLSQRLSSTKMKFRPHVPKDHKFKTFAADMLYYNILDVKANTAVYHNLDIEAGGWDWAEPIKLEKKVADIITRQEHRGFMFDTELAVEAVAELDALMEERRLRVEPLLPPKPATKKFMKDYTPPVRQFKKDRTPSADMYKFAEKVGGEVVVSPEGHLAGFKYKGEVLETPLEEGVALETEQVATIDDGTHIKNWLVSLGWEPNEYKEKDITVNTKKEKLTPEKYEVAVLRYVEQTLNTAFKRDRCAFLKTTPSKLKNKLLNADRKWATKVLTNPSFTVGQEKELCPDLERIAEQFPYVKDVVEYLTYKHRRNSILGGGAEWDEDEEAEKGYLSYVREDGRIGTPAGTCDAATGRFRHRQVVNIPRTSSLYGGTMRALFGCGSDRYQIAFDFDSLEARMEAHYCSKYDNDVRDYCNSLIQPKPNDTHSLMSKEVSRVLGYEFGRTPAKSVRYACSYGAQAPKIAKTIGVDEAIGKLIFDTFWEAAKPLSDLKGKLQTYWETGGGKKFILGLDGRKVPTRSQHALLNSLFQSAGTICVKRAMVIFNQKLRDSNLDVDFFKDDWRNKTYCQQMILNHDEQQMEITKDLVKFKTFDTEDEAKVFKDSNAVWGDIGHTDKGWYVAYSVIGILCREAVKECGEYYNLNVELTADYIVGRNWRDCH